MKWIEHTPKKSLIKISRFGFIGIGNSSSASKSREDDCEEDSEFHDEEQMDLILEEWGYDCFLWSFSLLGEIQLYLCPPVYTHGHDRNRIPSPAVIPSLLPRIKIIHGSCLRLTEVISLSDGKWGRLCLIWYFRVQVSGWTVMMIIVLIWMYLRHAASRFLHDVHLKLYYV